MKHGHSVGAPGVGILGVGEGEENSFWSFGMKENKMSLLLRFVLRVWQRALDRLLLSLSL